MATARVDVESKRRQLAYLMKHLIGPFLICLSALSLYSGYSGTATEESPIELNHSNIEWAPGNAICQTLGINGEPQFVLWGDSHGKVIVRLFDELATKYKCSGQAFTTTGFPPLLGATNSHLENSNDQLRWGENVIDWIVENEVPNVIIVGRWEARILDWNVDPGTRLLRLRDRLSPTPPDSVRAFADGLKRTLTALSECRVYFLMQPPVLDESRGPVSRSEYERQQRIIRGIVRENKIAMTVIEPDWFAGSDSIASDYYRDRDHMNNKGSERFIAPAVDRILRNLNEEMAARKSSRD
jgi:hypothetical protein